MPQIKGHVLDERRRPIDRATVSFRGKVIARSGEDGFFSARLTKGGSRLALTFAADGRVSNTRIFNTKAMGNQVVSLWPVAHRVRFDPTREFDAWLSGSRIQVPAGALTDNRDKPMSGAVDLRFTWFDVTDPVQRAAASGDFLGRLLDRRISRLSSYGIFDFDLRGRDDRPLKLRRGAEVGLAIAIPSRLVKQAPKEMGFFQFETTIGRWAEIDTFELMRSTMTYNGWFKRLVNGQYNLDTAQQTTCVTVKVVNGWNSAPMANMTVVAHGAQTDSYGTTNASGFTCLLVQRNAPFTAEAWGSIGSSDYGTPTPTTCQSPDIMSGAGDCGDPDLCPFVGTVTVDLIVGKMAM